MTEQILWFITGVWVLIGDMAFNNHHTGSIPASIVDRFFV